MNSLMDSTPVWRRCVTQPLPADVTMKVWKSSRASETAAAAASVAFSGEIVQFVALLRSSELHGTPPFIWGTQEMQSETRCDRMGGWRRPRTYGPYIQRLADDSSSGVWIRPSSYRVFFCRKCCLLGFIWTEHRRKKPVNVCKEIILVNPTGQTSQKKEFTEIFPWISDSIIINIE